MSFKAYSISQLSRELGISRQAAWQMVTRGGLPDGVTAHKVGNTFSIFVPAGKKIVRTRGGAPVDANQERPGCAVEWELADA